MKKSIEIYHSNIISLGYSLGYFHEKALTREDVKGVCCGFTIKWCEACLLHEKLVFKRRMDRILTNPPTLEQVDNIKEKVKAAGRSYNLETLTQDEKDILEICAWYDAIVIHQDPHFHDDLFGEKLNQSQVEQLSLIASSDKMAEQGGLKKIRGELNVYTEYSYADYLKHIRNACESTCRHGDVIAMKIKNYNHTLGITFTVGQGWSSVDINNIFEAVNPNFMAVEYGYSELDASLFINHQLFPYKYSGEQRMLQSDIIVPKNFAHREQLSNKILQICTIEIPKIRMLEAPVDKLVRIYRQYVLNYELPMEAPHRYIYRLTEYALINNHIPLLEALKKYGVEFNHVECQGTPAIVFAAYFCKFDFLEELTKIPGIDLNRPDKNGLTAFMVAAQKNDKIMLQWLLENTPIYNPIAVTVTVGEWKSFKYYSDEANQALNAFIKTKTGKQSVDDSTKISIFPEEAAAILGHNDCVTLFKEKQKVRIVNQSLLSFSMLRYFDTNTNKGKDNVQSDNVSKKM